MVSLRRDLPTGEFRESRFRSRDGGTESRLIIHRLPPPREPWAADEVVLEHESPLRAPLYAIGKFLSRIDSLDQMLSGLLARMTAIVPIDVAVLLEDRGGRRQSRLWHSVGVKKARIVRAEREARSTHEYLARLTPRNLTLGFESPSAAVPHVARPLPDSATREGESITLPLLGEDARVFGVLRVEGKDPLDELGLAFLNAVAVQLSVALDRYYAFRHEVELRRSAEAHEKLQKQLRLREREARLGAEQARRRLAFLAEASAFLSASLDSPYTLQSVGRLAVQKIADGFSVSLQLDPRPQPVISVRAGSPEAEVRQALMQLSLRAQEKDASVVTVRLRLGVQKISAVAIGVPLAARGKALGSLCLLTLKGRGFNSEEVLLAQDLGRRISMALDNSRLYQEAQQAIASRESLLAVVSHDLKTPLSSIMMSAALALSGTPEVERRKRGRRQLESILRSADRMKHLVRDLLDAASIEARHLTLSCGPQTPESLFEEVVQVMQPLAAAANLLLGVNVAPGLPELWVDRDRVLQVLFNLVGNAIKFTPELGRVILSATRAGPWVCLSVHDTGRGIAPDHLPHVFGQFWQAKDTAHMGTGLGLFISRGIVEAHGGTISVESTVEKGSEFRFTLPPVPPSVAS